MDAKWAGIATQDTPACQTDSLSDLPEKVSDWSVVSLLYMRFPIWFLIHERSVK